MTAKKTAEKKPAEEKKEEVKHFANVFEITHGVWPFSHKHYSVNVLELPATLKQSEVERASRETIKVARGLLGMKIKLLVVEEVEIANKDFITKKLSELLKK